MGIIENVDNGESRKYKQSLYLKIITANKSGCLSRSVFFFLCMFYVSFKILYKVSIPHIQFYISFFT